MTDLNGGRPDDWTEADERIAELLRAMVAQVGEDEALRQMGLHNAAAAETPDGSLCRVCGEPVGLEQQPGGDVVVHARTGRAVGAGADLH